jgi:DNA-binding NarL/FixJ family response regulator
MEDERQLQVMIVDDHAPVRQGIRAMLEDHGDIQGVGEACNGIEAIILVEKHRPNIVLMDINMPRMDGVEATAQIKRGYPDTIVIGMSVNASQENEETMRRAGAVRLIQKEEAAEVLYDAIHAAVQSRDPS